MSDREFLAGLPENPSKDWSDKDVKTGGTFTRVTTRPWQSLDFLSPTINTVAEMTTPVYNGLIRLTARQGLDNVMLPVTEGDLAAEWERPEPTVLVFKLRDGIKYQNVAPVNGRALTVDDIRFAFERAKTFEKSTVKADANFVARVEDAGGGTVRLILSQPYPFTDLLLSNHVFQIMPPEIGQNPDVAQRTAVGTGGFILEKAEPNVEAVFKKNPDYFKRGFRDLQQPYVDGYTLKVVRDEAAVMALLEAGQADTVYGSTTPINRDNVRGFLERNPDYLVQNRPQVHANFGLIGHADREPWSDPRVRRAVAMAMDHATVIESIYQGQAIVTPFMPWTAVTDQRPTLEDLGPYYQFNPAEAKKLLESAGFPNGIELEVLVYDHPALNDPMLLYQQYAAQAGVTLNLVASPDMASHYQTLTDRSWKDLIAAGRPPAVDPVKAMVYFRAGLATNYANMNDPTIEDAYKKVLPSQGEEHKQILRRVWDVHLDQVYWVMLPRDNQFNVMHRRLRNFVDVGWYSTLGEGSGNYDAAWLAQ